MLLFPDTFNDHFRPDTLAAAERVLNAAGAEVVLPRRPVCCGRPLFAWGMLDLAQRQLGNLLDVLAEDIAAGTPVVGLEPACLSALKDELQELFPKEPRAARLKENTFLLGDWLARQPDYQPPCLHRRALVHPHCHHHAVFGLAGARTMLERAGLDYELLDAGCCGMAGSFGFERDHYEVAQACGESVLLPAVRAADQDTLIITSGFSCREQIEQSTGRPTVHLAEVLALAEANRPT